MKRLRVSVLLVLFFSISSSASLSTDPLSKEELMKELMGGPSAKSSDDMAVYSEIVGFYQTNNPIKLRSRLQSLTKKFPSSNYIDNALYLAGRQSMENQNYPEALRYFQKIISQYPQSNRVVAAQFAKAMTYKKMNLNPQAKKVLGEIRHRFPGSPESFRAESELKLVK